jgi:hypothetical protein
MVSGTRGLHAPHAHAHAHARAGGRQGSTTYRVRTVVPTYDCTLARGRRMRLATATRAPALAAPPPQARGLPRARAYPATSEPAPTAGARRARRVPPRTRVPRATRISESLNLSLSARAHDNDTPRAQSGITGLRKNLAFWCALRDAHCSTGKSMPMDF